MNETNTEQKARRRPGHRLLPAILTLALLLGLGGPAGAVHEPAGALESLSGQKELVPMGSTVGIKLCSDGVMVVGTSQLPTDRGLCSPAEDCGLKEGDILTHLGEDRIGSTEHLQSLVAENGEVPVSLRILRDGKPLQMSITAADTGDGTYRLGAWVRDSMAGIGTMTFYDPESGAFGALGHGINDVDTQKLMPLASGAILPSRVQAVQKGAQGAPGELRGEFDQSKELGQLEANTDRGVFGTSNTSLPTERESLPIAPRRKVKTGPATILSNVSGDQVKEYEIQILRVYPGGRDSTRNLLLKVTDPELLEQTGGIVQGMSGSPILQNGMFVGAVTHVMVNDPTSGYGILMENMIAAE